MTSWKFLFPTIRFFTARKASLGLAKKKKKKGMVGVGLEPSSPTQKARHPSSGDSAKLEWVQSSLFPLRDLCAWF